MSSVHHQLDPIFSRHNARSPTDIPLPNIETNHQNVECDPNSSGDSGDMDGESSPENSGPSLLREMVAASAVSLCILPVSNLFKNFYCLYRFVFSLIFITICRPLQGIL